MCNQPCQCLSSDGQMIPSETNSLLRYQPSDRNKNIDI